MTNSASRTVETSPREVSRRENVEAILPMLPNQRALLLLSDLDHLEDPGFLQVRTTLRGSLDHDRFVAAWNDVISKHQGLRTSVHRRGDAEPVLIVWKHSSVDVTFVDWSSEDETVRRARMSSYLDADRDRGLDLTSAPPMRLIVITVAKDEHEMVWTCHHLFGDGWSATVTLEDLVWSYNAQVMPDIPGPREAPRDGLRSYHRWAATATDDTTRSYWTARVSGYRGAPVLRVRGKIGQTDAEGRGASLVVAIPDSLVHDIRTAASAASVTPNVFVEAAWASVLARLLNTRDVVFGTTVAGRSAPIVGIDRTVGYFSNAVPIRISIDPDETVEEWVIRIRNELFAMQPHEHASLGEVHEWSDVPGHRGLFDSFLVFENLPARTATPDHPDAITMTSFRSGLTAAFPLSIAVTLGDSWEVHADLDDAAGDSDGLSNLLEALLDTLRAMTADPEAPVGSLLATDAERIAGLLVPSAPGATASTGRRPETPLQRSVHRVWLGVLGLDSIAVDDDWFDIGGTSLGAVRLFRRIEDELGISLPLNTLLTHPTIAAMADRIESAKQASTTDRSLVVPLQPDGSRVPLFAIHGGGGEILYYKGLADRLGAEQPMYAIEPVGLDRVALPLETVPEMAERYLAEVRAIQPQGPYRFVGYCFGGNVALEMAARLENAGEEVDRLIVIDSGLPLEAARATTIVGRTLAILRTRGLAGAGRAAAARFRNRGRYYWDGSFGGAEGRDRLKYHAIAQACRRAFGSWEPRAVKAPIVLLRSTEYRPAENRDWHLGWDEYTPEFDVETIEGSQHEAMFEEPSVDQLADVVAKWIS
jgi:thioesterase domain-containing protein/acyl carrier protein